jgi:signal transduction histidine kinase
MTHEIRTPLNEIIGFSSLLNGKNLEKEEIEDYTSMINQSCNRLLEIVNNILEISSIQTGQIDIKKNPTAINSIFSDFINLFSAKAQEKQIAINYKNCEDPEIIIYTDEKKLNQIMANLINNAVKFTQSGNILIGYEIKDKFIEFFVKDTGIGISLDIYSRIFERFTQAEMSISRSYEGAGLGLAISKGLVELLGGKIWIESEVGKGSTFYFTIPKQTGFSI